jgi:chloramphenicol-sensitive protein RarD
MLQGPQVMSARSRTGVAFGLGAYLLWGAIPLYFKALARVDPTAIVAHRVLWSLGLLVILLTVGKRWPTFGAALRHPRIIGIFIATAVLISCNWLTYVWAIMHAHVLAASLGYYLNPLVNVLFGVLFLKERLSRLQAGAVAIAAAGVAVLAVGAAGTLWISLALAASFSLYGLLRKITPVDAVEGFSLETLLLAPLALAWLVWLERHGSPSLGIDSTTDLLLALSGVATATPLLLFNAAAKRLTYSALGFVQYVSPTIQLLLAVLLFREPVTPAQMVCLGLIWLALLLFAAEGVRNSRAAAREQAAAGL